MPPVERKVTAAADAGEVSALRAARMAQHAHLVRRIAHHMFRRRAYVNVDDLIEVGMIGLEEAMRAPANQSAEGFEAHASRFIRAAMLEFVRKANWSENHGNGKRPTRDA